MSKRLMYSKDIVARYHIPYSTVTYYTNMGFLTVVKKKGNKRLYHEDEVSRQLTRVTRLINKGYPLRLIRQILLEGENPNELL